MINYNDIIKLVGIKKEEQLAKVLNISLGETEEENSYTVELINSKENLEVDFANVKEIIKPQQTESLTNPNGFNFAGKVIVIGAMEEIRDYEFDYIADEDFYVDGALIKASGTGFYDQISFKVYMGDTLLKDFIPSYPVIEGHYELNVYKAKIYKGMKLKITYRKTEVETPTKLMIGLRRHIK